MYQCFFLVSSLSQLTARLPLPPQQTPNPALPIRAATDTWHHFPTAAMHLVLPVP